MIKVITGTSVKDGAGVKLNRVIGTEKLDNVDPFLLLDEFRSDNKEDYISGFPMHPHRGFETITYMVKGKFIHRDSKGFEGELKDGEVQWMTAGKGITHEEMPIMDKGSLWGYQLWVNLPKSLKMTEPKYRHLKNEELLHYEDNGIYVKIISGEYNKVKGPIELYYEIDYFDVNISGGTFEKELKGSNLIYVHTGNVTLIDDKEYVVKAGDLAVISDIDKIKVKGEDGGFLFLSAKPLKEPIARFGPFVMNTMEEILQAIDDSNLGRL